ncbi:MAG: transport system permease protein [Clostridiales bacterium]|nr:transport system permease protein [Clostridiales bacterium]
MKTLKKLTKIREMSSFLFLFILFLVVGLINFDFFTPGNIVACFNDSVVFTLLAVGMAFTIFTGEIDVSIGANLGFTAAVVGSLLRDGHNWVYAFLVGILVGALIGLFNGWGVAVLKIPSLIFTLGTNGLLRGLIYVYTGGAWVENLPGRFTSLSSKTIMGSLTVYYFVALVMVIVLHFILTKTKKGKYFIAVGDNAGGAVLVGIPAVQTKIIAYIACGIFAAAASIVYASRIGFVTAIAGNGYEMKAVAACVIGGISLTGGLGSVIGASIGAVIMSSVSRILVFMGFSSDYDNTITGFMLITIVVVDALLQRHSTEKIRHDRLAARATCETRAMNHKKGESA